MGYQVPRQHLTCLCLLVLQPCMTCTSLGNADDSNADSNMQQLCDDILPARRDVSHMLMPALVGMSLSTASCVPKRPPAQTQAAQQYAALVQRQAAPWPVPDQTAARRPWPSEICDLHRKRALEQELHVPGCLPLPGPIRPCLSGPE